MRLIAGYAAERTDQTTHVGAVKVVALNAAPTGGEV